MSLIELSKGKTNKFGNNFKTSDLGVNVPSSSRQSEKLVYLPLLRSPLTALEMIKVDRIKGKTLIIVDGKNMLGRHYCEYIRLHLVTLFYRGLNSQIGQA